MAAFSGKTVFVTGATSGIGRATALAFAGAGAGVLVCGRREGRLPELERELVAAGAAGAHAFALDVRQADAVEFAVRDLPQEFRSIDILVNNAGLSRGLAPMHAGQLSDWDEMIDTNVKGLLYVTRAVLPGMVERGSGHVINIGSIAGREVYPNGGVYCASKFAVDALTKGMRVDLNGTGVRVSTVDAGMVETEFSQVRFHGDDARAAKVYEGLTPLTAEDMAEAVLWVASRPARVTVAEVLMLTTDQANATVFHRKG